MAEDKKSCWNCMWQQRGGITFLGICRYFETIGKPNKDIPSSLVDVGCKFWKVRPVKEELVAEQVEGEIEK